MHRLAEGSRPYTMPSTFPAGSPPNGGVKGTATGLMKGAVKSIGRRVFLSRSFFFFFSFSIRPGDGEDWGSDISKCDGKWLCGLIYVPFSCGFGSKKARTARPQPGFTSSPRLIDKQDSAPAQRSRQIIRLQSIRCTLLVGPPRMFELGLALRCAATTNHKQPKQPGSALGWQQSYCNEAS